LLYSKIVIFSNQSFWDSFCELKGLYAYDKECSN
jgi:hypothetical protein